jgi:hypothetical protein
MQLRNFSLLSLVTAATLTVMMSPADAVRTSFNSTALHRIDVVTETDDVTITSAAFVSVPGAQVKVTIPQQGGSRLIVARFTAETECTTEDGLDESWCAARIVAVRDGIATELHPQVADNFALDSPPASADFWEGHSMERAIRLDPGEYFIRVQAAVVGTGVSFRLDDWLLRVEQYD